MIESFEKTTLIFCFLYTVEVVDQIANTINSTMSKKELK